jgi:hypothetical protein
MSSFVAESLNGNFFSEVVPSSCPLVNEARDIVLSPANAERDINGTGLETATVWFGVIGVRSSAFSSTDFRTLSPEDGAFPFPLSSSFAMSSSSEFPRIARRPSLRNVETSS